MVLPLVLDSLVDLKPSHLGLWAAGPSPVPQPHVLPYLPLFGLRLSTPTKTSITKTFPFNSLYPRLLGNAELPHYLNTVRNFCSCLLCIFYGKHTFYGFGHSANFHLASRSRHSRHCPQAAGWLWASCCKTVGIMEVRYLLHGLASGSLMNRRDSGSHDALLPADKVSRWRTLQASWGWGLLHFRMMELIDLFKSVSLILSGNMMTWEWHPSLQVFNYPYLRWSEIWKKNISSTVKELISGSEALGTDGDLGLKLSWPEQGRHWLIPLGVTI